MKKIFVSIILVSIFSSFSLSTIATELNLWIDTKTVLIYNNNSRELKKMDTAPIIIDGRTLVPIRFVSEFLNADVSWDEITKEATIKLNNNLIILTHLNNTPLVNGKQFTLSVPPKLLNGRLLVPIRFLSENMALDIQWVANEKKIIITKKTETLPEQNNTLPFDKEEPNEIISNKSVSDISQLQKHLILENDGKTEYSSRNISEFFHILQTAIRMNKSSINIFANFSDSSLHSNSIYTDFIENTNYKYLYPFNKYVSISNLLRTTNSNELSSFQFDLEYLDLPFEQLRSVELFTIDQPEDINKILEYSLSEKLDRVSIGYLKNHAEYIDDISTILLDSNSLESDVVGTASKYDLYKFGNHNFIHIEFDYSPLEFDYTSLKEVSSVETLDNEIKYAIEESKNSLILHLDSYDEKVNSYDLFSINNRIKDYFNNIKIIYSFLHPISPKFTFVKFEFEYLDEKNSRIANEEEIYKKLQNALINQEDTLSFNQEINLSSFNELTTNVSNHTLESTIKSWMLYSNGKIKFKYSLSKSNIEKANLESKKMVSEFITNDMTEKQKVKVIHDYIIDIASYSEGDLNSLPPESLSHYGILIENSGVCQGYASAFNVLAKLAGIKTSIVTGTAGENSIPHAWNIVEIDNHIYHIDVTFDDPIGSNFLSGINNSYFLLSDKYISKDHKWNTYLNSRKYFDYDN